jgi:predicted dehydrogenase
MASKQKRILILGTGLMANAHAAAFGADKRCKMVAAIDTNQERLDAFCKKYGVKHKFSTLDEAIAWGEFDAAVNVTPDAAHYPTTMAFLKAGKHVFCEKPLALNAQDAYMMVAEAEKRGLINMVNFTYRNASAIQEARRLVQSGALGIMRNVTASYRQSWLVQPKWGDWKTEDSWLWRLSTAHGSKGALGDTGVHIFDFVAYGADTSFNEISARLTTFDKAPGGKIGKYTLDANDSAMLHGDLANGSAVSIVITRFATGHYNDLFLEMHGTEGALRVWTDGHDSTLHACFGKDVIKAKFRKVKLEPTPVNATRFIGALISGKNGMPSFEDGAKAQQVIDACFVSDKSGKRVKI